MLGMARQLRVQYEGAIYHLMSRGDRRARLESDRPPFSLIKLPKFAQNLILPIPSKVVTMT